MTQSENQLEKKIGIVNTLADTGFVAGTADSFVLLLESGSSISIDSISVNLNRYKKRRIEAEGKWNSDKSIFMVDNVTSLGQETQVKTAYQNAQFGVKFQYPSVWILKEDQDALGLRSITIVPYEIPAGVDTIIVERSENNKRLSARQWLGLDEQYRPSEEAKKAAANALSVVKNDLSGTTTSVIEPVYQQSTIGVSQMDAVKKTYGNTSVEFYVSRDTFIYKFSHITINDSDKDLYRNAFYDLVQSFEFIPFAADTGTTTAVKTATPAVPTKATTPDAKPAKTESAQTPESVTPPAAPSATDLEKALKQKEEAAAAAKQKNLAETRQLFIDYIKTNIKDLTPEAASVGGTWFVTKVEFAFPEGAPENFNAIYVQYEDGHDARRILLSVADQTKTSAMTRVAYFKSGTSTDWVLSEGADTAKTEDKAIIPVATSSSSSSEVVVKKGMTLVNLKAYKVSIQYPANWYWAFITGGYGFGDKSVTSDNVLVKFTKDPDSKSLPQSMSPVSDTQGGGKPIVVQGELDGVTWLCFSGTTPQFCISGATSYLDTMKAMLETLQE